MCTVDSVALVGGFQCPANISDNSTSVCSPENTELQGIFMEVSIGINQTVYDPNRDPPWETGFEPTCQIGIPGITRTRNIVGNDLTVLSSVLVNSSLLQSMYVCYFTFYHVLMRNWK